MIPRLGSRVGENVVLICLVNVVSTAWGMHSVWRCVLLFPVGSDFGLGFFSGEVWRSTSIRFCFCSGAM